MDISLTQQEKQYIGKWIRWKRKENKLSQEEFLEAYPLCARKTLSRIENGKENVRPELLEDLLSVFGMRIPEVSDFQSVFSRSEWERLSRAYDLYDESLLQSCIRSMQKKLLSKKKYLWYSDLFDFMEILHDFIFNEVIEKQIVSLWRFLDPVWNETVHEIALAIHYRIYLMGNMQFSCQDALKKSRYLPNRIAYGYFLWENERHHSLSLYVDQLEKEVSFETNPIRMFDVWILKFISLPPTETEEIEKVWDTMQSHQEDPRLASKAKIHIYNLALAFFEKNELEKAALCLHTPDNSLPLAMSIVAILTFLRLHDDVKLASWLDAKADPNDILYPYFNYFQLKYKKRMNDDILIDVLTKDVWPLAYDDSYFRPFFEEEIRAFARKKRRYRLLALLE